MDPRSTQHLLPNAPPPSYSTDPPTSGPHASSGTVTGLQRLPIDEPVQVAVLEEGGIVVQYRPDLPAGSRETLAAMADEKVVIAPNPSLTDPFVATAWRHRLVCRSVDPAVLKAFIAERKGKGPG